MLNKFNLSIEYYISACMIIFGSQKSLHLERKQQTCPILIIKATFSRSQKEKNEFSVELIEPTSPLHKLPDLLHRKVAAPV
jgi:hypothetical protein